MGALDAETDPLVAERSQALVVVEFGGDLSEVLLAHELGSGAAPPRVIELMVGAVFLGWLGLAAAAGGAADIVLARDRSRAKRAELSEGALDLHNASIDLFEGAHAGYVATGGAGEEGGVEESR